MPRHYEHDERSTGYLYFTSSVQEAADYAFLAIVHDLRSNVYQYIYDKDERAKDSAIIAVRTSNIKKDFEIDPEFNLEDKNDQAYINLIRNKNNVLKKLSEKTKDEVEIVRYRHKGDIDTKYCFLHGRIKFSDYSAKDLDAMNRICDSSDAKIWINTRISDYLKNNIY